MMTLELVAMIALSGYESEPGIETPALALLQDRGGGRRTPTPYRPGPDIPGGGGSSDGFNWFAPRCVLSVLVGCWMGLLAGAIGVLGFRAGDEALFKLFWFIGVPVALVCGLVVGFTEGTPAPVAWVNEYEILSILLIPASYFGGLLALGSIAVRNDGLA